MGGGGGGQTQTVQKADPWTGVQPYLKDYLSQGQSQYNTPFKFNGGTQISPFSPEQQYGLAMTTQRAIQGSPVMNAAQGNAFDTLTGQYMNPDSNPWLKGTVDQALNDVTGRINSQFNNNNFGSSAHQELLSRSLGETAGNLYNQNYQQERARQQQMVGLSPTLAETDYRDAQALMGVGDARRGLAQDYLNQANTAYQNYLNYPQSQLDAYGNVIRTGMGAGGTTTTTGNDGYSANPIAGALGGAATGFSVGGPWGALIGAGLGLLS